MPIDNATKRRSAAGTGCVALLPGVTPDNTRPAAWRRSAGWSYSGVPSVGPVVDPGGGVRCVATGGPCVIAAVCGGATVTVTPAGA